MGAEARKNATNFSFLQPEDGNVIVLPGSYTFGLISQAAFRDLKLNNQFTYNDVVYYKVENDLKELSPTLIKVFEPIEGTEMWILDNLSIPIVWKMKNNPLQINWEVQQIGNNPLTIRDELRKCSEKTGSVYYAYNYEKPEYSPVPQGYKPFYISHYGRHGSRWIPTEERYTNVISIFNDNQLTPLGKEVSKRLEQVWDNAKGNAGQLTPLGKKQHQEIAIRMYHNYSSIFTNNKNVDARSSVVNRCINSMTYFSNELKELQTGLKKTTDSDTVHMSYIACETKEMKEVSSKNADWPHRNDPGCPAGNRTQTILAVRRQRYPLRHRAAYTHTAC